MSIHDLDQQFKKKDGKRNVQVLVNLERKLYFPGQTIKGVVYIHIPKSFLIRGLWLDIRGSEKILLSKFVKAKSVTARSYSELNPIQIRQNNKILIEEKEFTHFINHRFYLHKEPDNENPVPVYNALLAKHKQVDSTRSVKSKKGNNKSPTRTIRRKKKKKKTYLNIYLGDIEHLAAGNHEFPFTFKLPDSLPSSFSKEWIEEKKRLNYGKIAYSIKAVVLTHMGSFQDKQKFLIQEPLQNDFMAHIQQKNYELSGLCCMRFGKLNVAIASEKTTYHFGEEVNVYVQKIKGIKRSKLKRCYATLTRRIRIQTQGGKTKIFEKVLYKKDKPCAILYQKKFCEFKFKILEDSEEFYQNYSSSFGVLIKCEYIFRVTIKTGLWCKLIDRPELSLRLHFYQRKSRIPSFRFYGITGKDDPLNDWDPIKHPPQKFKIDEDDDKKGLIPGYSLEDRKKKKRNFRKKIATFLSRGPTHFYRKKLKFRRKKIRTFFIIQKEKWRNIPSMHFYERKEFTYKPLSEEREEKEPMKDPRNFARIIFDENDFEKFQIFDNRAEDYEDVLLEEEVKKQSAYLDTENRNLLTTLEDLDYNENLGKKKGGILVKGSGRGRKGGFRKSSSSMGGLGRGYELGATKSHFKIRPQPVINVSEKKIKSNRGQGQRVRFDQARIEVIGESDQRSNSKLSTPKKKDKQPDSILKNSYDNLSAGSLESSGGKKHSFKKSRFRDYKVKVKLDEEVSESSSSDVGRVDSQANHGGEPSDHLGEGGAAQKKGLRPKVGFVIPDSRARNNVKFSDQSVVVGSEILSKGR